MHAHILVLMLWFFELEEFYSIFQIFYGIISEFVQRTVPAYNILNKLKCHMGYTGQILTQIHGYYMYYVMYTYLG